MGKIWNFNLSCGCFILFPLIPLLLFIIKFIMRSYDNIMLQLATASFFNNFTNNLWLQYSWHIKLSIPGIISTTTIIRMYS